MPHDLADASSAKRSSLRERAWLPLGAVWLVAAGVVGALVGDAYGAALVTSPTDYGDLVLGYVTVPFLLGLAGGAAVEGPFVRTALFAGAAISSSPRCRSCSST